MNRPVKPVNSSNFIFSRLLRFEKKSRRERERERERKSNKKGKRTQFGVCQGCRYCYHPACLTLQKHCVRIYIRARAHVHTCVCVCVVCLYVCVLYVCVCVPSFIRSLRDAQVFYNVATGARVPVFVPSTISHFSTRYTSSRNLERKSLWFSERAFSKISMEGPSARDRAGRNRLMARAVKFDGLIRNRRRCRV